MLRPRFRVPSTALIALLLAACSGLQPLDLEPEYTAAPAQSDIWLSNGTNTTHKIYTVTLTGGHLMDFLHLIS